MVKKNEREGSKHFSFRIPEPTASLFETLIRNTGESQAQVATKAIQLFASNIVDNAASFKIKTNAIRSWYHFHVEETQNDPRPTRSLDKKRKRT